MRAVSFLGEGLSATGGASAKWRPWERRGRSDWFRRHGRRRHGRAGANGRNSGAEGGRGGGMRGRVACGGGGGGVRHEEGGSGERLVARWADSFFGATPGAVMRTVSRLVIGVVSGLGGRVMRTVSFFGPEGARDNRLFSEGVSSAIVQEDFLCHHALGSVKHLRLWKMENYQPAGPFFKGAGGRQRTRWRGRKAQYSPACPRRNAGCFARSPG